MLRYTLQLLIAPRRFAEAAREDAKQLPKRGGDQFDNATADVRGAVCWSFALVAMTVAAGWVCAAILRALLGPAPTAVNRVLQVVGVGVLLWATLAKQGWNIQTINGGTLPERLDRLIYRALYIIGSFSLAISVFWQPAATP